MINNKPNTGINFQTYQTAFLAETSSILHHLSPEGQSILPKEQQKTSEKWQFLTLLVQLMGAKRAIEVGVFHEYNTLQTANILSTNAQIVACDVGTKWAQTSKQATNNTNTLNRPKIRLGSAVETLQALLGEGKTAQFDFAFIGADKQNYPSYYQYCLQLVRPGGLIAIDNTMVNKNALNQSELSADTIAIQAINRMVRADARVDVSLVPLENGVLLARKLD